MARPHDVPLVGPGNELQLTIDGRAIPHADVVAAVGAAPASAPDAREVPQAGADPDGPPVEQPRLPDL